MKNPLNKALANGVLIVFKRRRARWVDFQHPGQDTAMSWPLERLELSWNARLISLEPPRASYWPGWKSALKPIIGNETPS